MIPHGRNELLEVTGDGFDMLLDNSGYLKRDSRSRCRSFFLVFL